METGRALGTYAKNRGMVFPWVYEWTCPRCFHENGGSSSRKPGRIEPERCAGCFARMDVLYKSAPTRAKGGE